MIKIKAFFILSLITLMILSSCSSVDMSIDMPTNVPETDSTATGIPVISTLDPTQQYPGLTPFPTETDFPEININTSNYPSSVYKDVSIKSPYVFVYDLEDGLLYSKGNLTEKIYPASVTKL